jgi:serine/threonine protein kinase
MTEVWRVRSGDGRVCVAKCASANHAIDRGAARLLEREWELLRAGAGPGVVEAYGLERSEHGPILITAYLPNGDLVTLAGAHPRRWAGALRDLAGTLRALHGSGVVHRDVKPRNVLFDSAERATLIDFASAAYCGARVSAGGVTAAYRPPARASETASPVEDEAAFAAVVYELLAGRPPFALTGSRAGSDGFVPLAARQQWYEDDPEIRALASLVDAVLGSSPKEPGSSLAVFQTALDAIIATR